MNRPSQLASQFKKSGVPPWVVLIGDEELLRAEARQAISAALGDDADFVEVDWAEVADPEEGLKSLFDELRTGSLFAGSKLVSVRRASSLLTGQVEALKRLFQAPGAGTLLLEAADLYPKKKGQKLAPALEALQASGGCIVDCSPLVGRGDAELMKWLVERASALGKALPLDAAHRLRERDPGDLRALAGQLEKLALHVGARAAITPQDVDEVVGDEGQRTLFEVVDAFALRRLGPAVDALERVLRQGSVGASGQKSFSQAEVTIRLVALLALRLRELGRIAELRREGFGYEESVAQVLGAGRSWLAGRMRPQVEARTPREVGEAVLALSDLDCALKSGGGDPRDLACVFLVEHGSAPNASTKNPYARSRA
ncbi:MAG: DNA polymerase III subunit delta [Planctomycetes bacterium]|nr:DNA polymerase III subunit delta [Planctomycetota bacterium]